MTINSLAEWQNFYVIAGSAAGGLTGLQFVVMAFIADVPMKDGEGGASEAFATPTIVHFVAVLMLSASMVMPWHSLVVPAITWGVAGLAGVCYMLLTTWRMRTQTGYKPVWEDWLYHGYLPVAAYAGLLSSACCLLAHTRGALFGIAGVVLLLLFIAIHNSWDNVTYLVFVRRKEAVK
jgi:hypothetical protein